MRVLRLTIFLGLVGLAYYKFAKPKLPAAKAQVAKLRERIEPALRDATTRVETSSKDAAESVRDASLAVAETADSVANAIPDPETTDPSGARSTDQTHATSRSR